MLMNFSFSWQNKGLIQKQQNHDNSGNFTDIELKFDEAINPKKKVETTELLF